MANKPYTNWYSKEFISDDGKVSISRGILAVLRPSIQELTDESMQELVNKASELEYKEGSNRVLTAYDEFNFDQVYAYWQ